ncbi:MAG: hypothetical protein P1U56_20440 [Saprospiraceae bacterium]|nr:hypothetical protein [Saprospiraceae bacterium]
MSSSKYINASIIGIIFFLIEILVVNKFEFMAIDLISDLATMIFFSAIVTSYIIKWKKELGNSFGNNYFQGIKIGLIAVGIYLLIILIFVGVENKSGFGFLDSIINQIPFAIGESVIKLILIILFSLVPAIYYSFKIKREPEDILDAEFIKQNKK